MEKEEETTTKKIVKNKYRKTKLHNIHEKKQKTKQPHYIIILIGKHTK